jgi:hypothetical protein
VLINGMSAVVTGSLGSHGNVVVGGSGTIIIVTNISTAGYKAAHPGRVRCNDVWFPIEVEGTTGNSSRYIHIGHLSEGCVTFYELLKWNDIYDYLIDKRMKEGKGKYIGKLIVEK